jgi:tetratricopeptide (TPR) repeat protein
MLIEEWFRTLAAKLQAIEKEWPTATESRKMILANQLFELRQISDHLVDLWLRFEEKLSGLIGMIKQKETDTQKTADNGTEANAGPGIEMEQSEKPGSYRHIFRKGEGFYHLRLYHDAKDCFADLLKESPDWENGRLYYAYSLLFCEEKEAALREFRLLSRSASSPKVISISYNAIGCMLAEEGQWLEAAQAFHAALGETPLHREALFNLALCYLHNEDAQEALDAIERYMQVAEDDWEAQIVWLVAFKMLRESGCDADVVIPARLIAPTRQLNPETLREMAALFESTGQYHRARLCYYYIAEQLPSEGWAWHGLAWTTWLIDGAKSALSLVKKAISLAPGNLDFHFSYGWMLLDTGQVQQAFRAFRFILAKQQNHRLAQSGLITAYAQLGRLSEARAIADSFLHEEDEYVRSLGNYHLGRLALQEENWQLAERHFRDVKLSDSRFPEVSLYRQLCKSKLGVPFSAEQTRL